MYNVIANVLDVLVLLIVKYVREITFLIKEFAHHVDHTVHSVPRILCVLFVNLDIS